MITASFGHYVPDSLITSIDKLIKRIDSNERQAIELNDLSTAIKLNWLRNAVTFDSMNIDEAEEKRQAIVILGKFVKPIH